MFFPSYFDLGKAARELFTKGYNYGLLRVDTTSKTGENREIEFKTSAAHTISTGRLAGSVDVKYRIPSCGITLIEKWNTDNLVSTIVEIQDQFARGLKLTLDSCFTPPINERSGRVRAEYIGQHATLNFDFGLETGPLLNFSAVTGLRGWLLGMQSGFDVANSKLKTTGFAFGKIGPDYVIHSFVNNGQDFGASFFHRVAPNVDIGAQLGWTYGENGARLGLATRYSPSNDLEIKAKVDHESKVAFAVTHYLSNQLRLTLSSQFGLADFNSGGHKVGLGLEFRPCC